MRTSDQMLKQAKRDPTTSYRLQEFITKLDQADVVDAMAEVEYLTKFINLKLEECGLNRKVAV